MTAAPPGGELIPAKKTGGDAGGKELPAEYGTVAAMIADWEDRDTLDHTVEALRSSMGFWLGLSALQSVIFTLGLWSGVPHFAFLAMMPLTLEAIRRSARGFVDHSIPTLGEVILGAPQHIFRATFLGVLLVLVPFMAGFLAYATLVGGALLVGSILLALGPLGNVFGLMIGCVIFALYTMKIWSNFVVLILSVPALALGDRPFLAYRRTLRWLPARRPKHYFEVFPLLLPTAAGLTLFGVTGSVIPSLAFGVASVNVFLLHATHRYLRDYCRWAVHVRRKSVGLTTLDPDMLLSE